MSTFGGIPAIPSRLIPSGVMSIDCCSDQNSRTYASSTRRSSTGRTSTPARRIAGEHEADVRVRAVLRGAVEDDARGHRHRDRRRRADDHRQLPARAEADDLVGDPGDAGVGRGREDRADVELGGRVVVGLLGGAEEAVLGVGVEGDGRLELADEGQDAEADAQLLDGLVGEITRRAARRSTRCTSPWSNARARAGRRRSSGTP